jgi:hypothetical protein
MDPEQSDMLGHEIGQGRFVAVLDASDEIHPGICHRHPQ